MFPKLEAHQLLPALESSISFASSPLSLLIRHLCSLPAVLPEPCVASITSCLGWDGVVSSSSSSLAIATILNVLLSPSQSLLDVAAMSSATCYYPNGVPSQGGDIPCSSGDGGQCCPQGWTCQDNGLCYLENQQYYGRYTCTDQSWKSDQCPKICTESASCSIDPNGSTSDTNIV